jgi:hypothetical protein
MREVPYSSGFNILIDFIDQIVCAHPRLNSSPMSAAVRYIHFPGHAICLSVSHEKIMRLAYDFN